MYWSESSKGVVYFLGGKLRYERLVGCGAVAFSVIDVSCMQKEGVRETAPRTRVYVTLEHQACKTRRTVCACSFLVSLREKGSRGLSRLHLWKRVNYYLCNICWFVSICLSISSSILSSHHFLTPPSATICMLSFKEKSDSILSCIDS